jgi:hypothetical protein
MQEITVNFQGINYTFSYFGNTFSVGSEANSPIFNVYGVIAPENAVPITGETFHIIKESTPGTQPFFNLSNPANPIEYRLKGALAEAILTQGY